MDDPAFQSLMTAAMAALPTLRGAVWQPLSGGRTNHLWRVGDLVVKAYDPTAGTPLFPNDPAAEARALALLGPSGLAPHLAAAGDGWIAYAHVDGAPWRNDPAPVATALHRLHRQPGAGFRDLASGSAAILRQGHAIAGDCRATLPPPPPDPGLRPIGQSCLIHGDAVPGNIIVASGGVTLIDWQCPARGDPCEDLATFLSPAMQWLYRGAILTAAEAERFLAAYPDSALTARYSVLAPLFRWRMAAHCQWKAERGAADYATALKLELDG